MQQPLTHDQQHAIDEFRYRLHKHLIVEIHGFMQQHRDIHVEWAFTLEGTSREEVQHENKRDTM